MDGIAATPIQKLPRLSERLGIDLRVKRDDLLPLPGGGNKARKIWPILESARRDGATALITAGSAESNHARATALAAAREGMKCYLVLHDEGNAAADSANLLLARLTGAVIELVPPERIADSIAEAAERLRLDGERPFVVPGGGHCRAGGMAYVKAAAEAVAQWESQDWSPVRIVLASGTGTTQAGLVAGLRRENRDVAVTGISVARPAVRGGQAVREALSWLDDPNRPLADGIVDFRDDWVGDGYARADARVFDTILAAARHEGLPLDPTYTGKAFLGMQDMIQSKEIAPGDRVLFWHTGGLLNLVTSPHRSRLIPS